MAFVNFITTYKEVISICVSVIVGLATIITSIAAIIVAKHQVEISQQEQQMHYQSSQPIFEVCLYQQQDGDDGKYGNDILYINKVDGQTNSCKTSVNVFYQLSKTFNGVKKTIYIKVSDYFFRADRDIEVAKNIKRYSCPGNNRGFSNFYFETLECNQNSDATYICDKIILVEIEYKDIFNDTHILYYENGNQIDKEKYRNYFEESSSIFNTESYPFNKINFQDFKIFIDNLLLK